MIVGTTEVGGAELFRALSDLTRLRIVGLLMKQELCVGELEYLLGVSQTNVSRHLERLRTAGLVSARRQAQWIYYSIRPELPLQLPALRKLVEEVVARTNECREDRTALEEYRSSGMSCEELPNCRANRTKIGRSTR